MSDDAKSPLNSPAPGRKITRVRDTLAKKDKDNFDYSDFSFGEFGDYVNNPTSPPRQVSRLSATDRILAITVKNNSNKTKTVNLFDADWYQKHSSDKDISIKCHQSSYSLLLTSLLQNPIKLKGMKLKANDTKQLSNPIEIIHVGPMGATTSMQYDPYNSISAYDYDSTRVDCVDFEADVDCTTCFKFDILGNEMVNFNFYISSVHAGMSGRGGGIPTGISPSRFDRMFGL